MNVFDGLIFIRLVHQRNSRPRGRIALADQVDPERLLDFRRQPMRRDGQSLLRRRLPHLGRATAPTHAATTGCSTSVSTEITWIGFRRCSAGSSRTASQTNCSAALESLPPL